MKILWFTNTPCGATEILTGQIVTGGGWLNTLSEQIKSTTNIELHIAFYHTSQVDQFEYEGIWYHPIYRKAYMNKWQLIKGQFLARFSTPNFHIDIKNSLKVVNDVNPDIVHIHGSEENFGLMASHISNRKVVLSIQGLLNPITEKLYAGIPKTDVLKNDSLIQKILNIGVLSVERQFTDKAKIETEILKTISFIIGRTKWDYDCSLALNPKRKYYIVNEILRNEFLHHHWTPRKKDNQLVIATTVSNGLFKGVENIYKTAKVLKDAGFDFIWNVIGISEGDSITKLSESYTRLRATDLNINLLGRKTAPQMLEILDNTDLFVQVSHIENSPNSLCEAMVIGMPIVASFAGGTSSMLKDGEEGILVQNGDSYSMAGAIIHASQDYAEMLSMAANARQRALSRHNPDSVCQELIDVYNSIIESNG